jgi:hypothetical protein
MGWRDEEARKILRRHEIAMSSLRPEGLRPEDWVDLKVALWAACSANAFCAADGSPLRSPSSEANSDFASPHIGA